MESMVQWESQEFQQVQQQRTEQKNQLSEKQAINIT